LIDPGLDGLDLGWGERSFAGGHAEIAVAPDGFVKEAGGGIAGDDGGASVAPFLQRFKATEIEAGGLDGAVALETFGLENVLGRLRVEECGNEQEPRHKGHSMIIRPGRGNHSRPGVGHKHGKALKE
jgi:hypothetical protein